MPDDPNILADHDEPGDPRPARRCRVRLDTMGDVKQQLARLYRSGLSGGMDTRDAARLASILALLQRTIEQADLERRVEVLEQTRAGRPAYPRPVSRL